MVTFTCNNCGDSVKKNRVEKHYSIECRRKCGGPNVCCIDCLKDFRQDYEQHTSCQTEDERYAAKGTYIAKESKNKQLKKQMTWSEIIQSVVDTQNISISFKDILNVLKESDNVPRKEPKFKNFCKNNGHLRRFSENDITGVFNLIQNEFKKNTEAIKKEKEEALAVAKNKENIKTSGAKKRSISESAEDNDESFVQSKKIKPNETSEVIEKDSCKEKKKKSKKKTSNEGDVDMENIPNGKHHSTLNSSVDASTTNGKKKKEGKSKIVNTSSTVMEVQENVNLTIINGDDTANSIEASAENNLTNGHNKSKKKKKKKHSTSDETAHVTEEIKADQDSATFAEDENNSSLRSKSPKKKRKSTEPEKTPFKEVVAKLLKPGTEFKLKSLKKMVFAVYKSGEEEVPREVRENFNKKLLKIPNIQINEKIVKMVK